MRAKFVPEPVCFVNGRIELELRPDARVIVAAAAHSRTRIRLCRSEHKLQRESRQTFLLGLRRGDERMLGKTALTAYSHVSGNRKGVSNPLVFLGPSFPGTFPGRGAA